ncbi:acyltransferase family protein [Pseudomonas urmiensis]|uniref:Acyltransferase n=1 Tax=Pseudomonas urmiensis TaxID=2745493 RepID=A0A923G195_9PSED|nr:acyltransferase [Pseudomonas urmiensis]MBV4537356.1 acyltransferase [Pseudomonas urmiensis]
MTLSNLLPLIIFSLFIAFAWATTIKHGSAGSINNNRFAYIDGLRGIAAVVVVVTHFWRTTPSSNGISFLFDGRANYGPIGVQIFFCITGFLFFGQIIAKKGVFSWSTFYRSRVRRILPAYLAFYALGIITVLAYGDITKASTEQIPSLADMLFFGFAGKGEGKMFASVPLDLVFGVIWTLKYEIIFYITLPFITYLVARTGIGAGLSIMFAAVGYELASTGTTFAGYFLTGGIAYILAQKTKPSTATKFLCGLCILSLIYYLITSNYQQYGVKHFIVSSSLFLLITLCKPTILESKPLRYLGEISYSIYLLHAPLLILNRVLFANILNIGTQEPQNYILVTFIGTTLIFGASAIQHKYLELPFITKSKPLSSMEEQIKTSEITIK